MHFSSVISMISIVLAVIAPQVWARPNPIVALGTNSGHASNAAVAGSSAQSNSPQGNSAVPPPQTGAQSGSGQNASESGAAHQSHGTPPNNSNFGGSGVASEQRGGSDSGTQGAQSGAELLLKPHNPGTIRQRLQRLLGPSSHFLIN